MPALLFDMDGVLVNSVGHWTDARDRVIRNQLGIEGFDVENLIGLNVRDEYELLAESHPLPVSSEEYVDLIEEYSSSIYREKVELLPGVRHVIEHGSGEGIALGVVSASSRHRVEMVLDRFDLAQPFDVVVGADDIDGNSKPSPDLYVTAMEKLDVEPDETIVVEDSVHGVKAAQRAGAYCLRYDHDWARGETEADEIFSDADELRDRLIELLDHLACTGTVPTT